MGTTVKYLDAKVDFLKALQEREKEFNEKDKIQFPHSQPATFSIMNGSKFDRVVRHSHGSKSAYAFINRITGGIIKVASWKQPDIKKYERGNIFNENCLEGTERFGVVYLR